MDVWLLDTAKLPAMWLHDSVFHCKGNTNIPLTVLIYIGAHNEPFVGDCIILLYQNLELCAP